MIDLVAVLAAEGLAVEDHRRHPVAGLFDPVGVMLHHTASRPRAGDPAPSLRVVRDIGNMVARAPLCNVLVGRDCVCRVITDGRANDSGRGSGRVLERIRQGWPPVADARDWDPVSDTDGSPWFFDVEVENDGLGEPWASDLIATTARVAAAICRARGWTSNVVVLHREWTARKTDPNFADGATWRRLVAGLLRPAVTVPRPPSPEEDDMPRARIIRNREGGEIALPVPELGIRRKFATTEAAVDAVRAGIADPWPDAPRKPDGQVDEAARVPGDRGGWAWNDVDPGLFEALPSA